MTNRVFPGQTRLTGDRFDRRPISPQSLDPDKYVKTHERWNRFCKLILTAY
jgi:hypothetical protein